MPGNGAATLIQLQSIKKVFYTDEVETHALADVHLGIKQGEYVAIAGPSGCGKTTLLSILGLLDTPTDGSYLLDNQPVANLSAADRARVRNRQIAFIFQAFNLIGVLTVYENVELPLTYRGLSGAERKKRVTEALERVGMSHRIKHYPAQLSGGQQQRAAAVRGARGGGGRPGNPAPRRADGQPRLLERRSRDGAVARAAPRRRHDLHGDARPALRRPRRSHDRAVRRPGGGGARGGTGRGGASLDGDAAPGSALLDPLPRAEPRADARRRADARPRHRGQQRDVRRRRPALLPAAGARPG